MNTRAAAHAQQTEQLDALLEAVRARATSIGSQAHGDLHARHVAHVGLELARHTPGADAGVVFAFALLHDSMRESDQDDAAHGRRAAGFARRLHTEGLLPLREAQLGRLTFACRFHHRGHTTTDPDIGCCWDADRLNLWRVGIRPRPALLSTAAAPLLVEWAALQLTDEPPAWPALAAYLCSAD